MENQNKVSPKNVLQQMLDDKKAIREARLKNPAIEDVKGIKILDAVPLRQGVKVNL